MGLFDFASNIGRKLFDKEDVNAENAIKEMIEKDNPGVTDLEVKVDEGVCTLCGKAATRASFEKVVLMAGNVMGISEVKADEMEIMVKATDVMKQLDAEDDVTYYIIESGDTLSGIAKRFLGDAMKYPDIFEANREVIYDPDKIFPGQKIRIPKA